MITMRLKPVKWPLKRPFRIARAVYHHVDALQIELEDEHGNVGRAEGLGDDFHGETIAGLMDQLNTWSGQLTDDLSRTDILDRYPRGAARYLLDAAMWDLQAKATGIPAWETAGVDAIKPRRTAFTLGLGEPKELEQELRTLHGYTLLKIKVEAQDPRPLLDRVRAVNSDADLILDANASWTPPQLRDWLPNLPGYGISLVEQPLPVDQDQGLLDLEHVVPIAADESCTDSASLPGLIDKYDAVNIKLEKTGGLTEALRVADLAQAAGLDLMVGCMGGSSLAMAPAALIAPRCRWIDLDGPLLQTQDIEFGIEYDRGIMGPPSRELWG